MGEPRFKFVWWGDGYFVYDGDEYIGKDDQVDLIYLMEQAGVAEKLNEDEEVELDYGPDTFEEMKEILGG